MRLIIFAGLNIIFLSARLIVVGVGFMSARVSVGDASASMSLENRAKNEELPKVLDTKIFIAIRVYKYSFE